MRSGWVVLACIAVGLMVAACGGTPTATPTAGDALPRDEGPTAFSLSSEAFDAGEAIPRRYTCEGEDISPALSWAGTPHGTRSFTVIADDPDAPGGTFTHWVAFNLPAGGQGLPEGVPTTEQLENGALQGRNDFGRIGYGGPCPPPGSPHRYRFFLYALDASLDLAPGASKQQVLDGMRGHILGETELVGTYQR